MSPLAGGRVAAPRRAFDNELQGSLAPLDSNGPVE